MGFIGCLQSFGIYANTNEFDGSYITLANNNNQTASIKLYARGSNGRIEFHNQNFQVMSIRADNNIYIGDPNNISNVYMNGSLECNTVKVSVNEWWDDVFEDDYSLLPLNQLETYIKEHKHLPDMPDESSVISNGLDIGEMNSLLLKKIEELSLHIIELEKKINK